MSKASWKLLAAAAFGALIWVMPVPEGLHETAWHLFAIFAATILGFILQPLSLGAMAFISLTVTALTGVLKVTDVLSGFSQATVWLIVGAFLFSRGFVKTGLGKRIAFYLIRYFGTSSLGLAYVLICSDLIVAPATPSNTARLGGVIFPITRSLSSSFGSEPGATAKRFGSFFMQAVYHGDTPVSGMFMTAMAGNPLMASLALAVGVEITWGSWFLGAAVPALISLLLIPIVLYYLENPEIKKTPEAKAFAEKELAEMGPMKSEEKKLAFIFVSALGLWATTQITGLNATLIGMAAISAMILFHVLEWKDVIEEKSAWDTMIWMGGLICLAGFLNKTGMIPWFSQQVGASLSGFAWEISWLLIVLLYTYSHYLFASLNAHIAAMFAAFLAVGAAAGIPPYLLTMSLFGCTAIMQGVTHYAAGPTPIFFGAGFVSQARWWRNGLIVSFLNLVIWIGGGAVWWKIIGFW